EHGARGKAADVGRRERRADVDAAKVRDVVKRRREPRVGQQPRHAIEQIEYGQRAESQGEHGAVFGVDDIVGRHGIPGSDSSNLNRGWALADDRLSGSSTPYLQVLSRTSMALLHESGSGGAPGILVCAAVARTKLALTVLR